MKLNDVRTTLKYVPQFQGRTFVLSLDGGVLASGNFSNFLIDLAILRSLGVRVVLVFGATPQVRGLAAERGCAASDWIGFGPMNEELLEAASDAVGRLTTKLTRELASAGIRAATANVLTVYAAGIIDGIDHVGSGRVASADADSISGLLQQDLLPIIGPLGFSAKGQTLYLNSDAVAAEIAIALKASKILYASDRNDCPLSADVPTQLSIRDLDVFEAENRARIDDLLASKLRFARRACEEGVSRVHLIPGFHEEAILAELFSAQGIGAMIYADVYQKIRKAVASDVDAIVSMTRRAVEEQQLVARGKEEFQAQLDEFWILEVDGNLVGCAALHVYAELGSAEIASVFVGKKHVGQGYGSTLLAHLENTAREMGLDRLIGFTTQAEDYFVGKLGFRKGADLAWVSEERRADYEKSGRNSIVFWKPLKAEIPQTTSEEPESTLLRGAP
ncbi:MAG: amino-acid N-acetyltransferase [Verrucomicrobiales bacterium]|jgi:amino-acid N-acetyltransferase